MRPEEGDLAGDLAGEAREPGFARNREVVARFDLEGRGALRVHLGDESAQPRAQIVVGGRPGRRDRATDAAGGIRLSERATAAKVS